MATYAIGDVNGRALLTHMGKYQARIAADVILGHSAECLPANATGSRSPRVIFTDPHVAAVGYTLDAAQQDGLNVRAVEGSGRPLAPAVMTKRQLRAWSPKKSAFRYCAG